MWMTRAFAVSLLVVYLLPFAAAALISDFLPESTRMQYQDVVGTSATSNSFPVYAANEEDFTERVCYLIKVDSSISDVLFGRVSDYMNHIGLEVQESYSLSQFRGYHVCLPTGMDVLPLDLLRQVPFIKYVEREHRIRANAFQVESPAPWGLDRMDMKPDGPRLSKDYTIEWTGNGTNIYILDSGVNPRHLEFNGRAQTVFSAVANDSTDPFRQSDCTGHGTHVSGIAAGTNAGVAKLANIHMLRFFDCSEFSDLSLFVKSLQWLVANHQKPAVLSLSLASQNISATIEDAVMSVLDANITVVAAAGNYGVNACTSSPARMPEVITVGTSSQDDAMASFSNFGSCVSGFAPGVNIVSALYNTTTGYTFLSGTSMSAPFVTGAVALVLERHPDYTPAQVFNELRTFANENYMRGNLTGSPNVLFQVPQTTDPTQVPVSFVPLARNGTLPPDLPFISRYLTTSEVPKPAGFSMIVQIALYCVGGLFVVLVVIVGVTQYKIRRLRKEQQANPLLK